MNKERWDCSISFTNIWWINMTFEKVLFSIQKFGLLRAQGIHKQQSNSYCFQQNFVRSKFIIIQYTKYKLTLLIDLWTYHQRLRITKPFGTNLDRIAWVFKNILEARWNLTWVLTSYEHQNYFFFNLLNKNYKKKI